MPARPAGVDNSRRPCLVLDNLIRLMSYPTKLGKDGEAILLPRLLPEEARLLALHRDTPWAHPPPPSCRVTHYSGRRVQPVRQRRLPHVLLTYFFFSVEVAISLAATIISPFPSVYSALVCLASTEAIHIVLSEALSISIAAPSFLCCIAEVP